MSAVLIAGGVAVAAGLVGLGRWFFMSPMPPASAVAAEHCTVSIGGRERSYRVVKPAVLSQGAPVLLVLHGSLMNGENMRRMLGPCFERLASRRGAVVVYPTGVEGHFNEGRLAASYSARTLNIDDVGFMRAIVDALEASLGVDRRRVLALGYSNGGGMAMRLACEAPDLVAGIIVANANLPTADNMAWAMGPTAPSVCAPKVVLIEGTRDPINPYEGGQVTIFGFSSRGTVLSALASARWFAQRAGLVAEPTSDATQRVGPLNVRQQDWGTPAQVRLVTMQGAGHTVPQADYRFPKFLGATVQSDALLDAAWTMLDDR